MAAVKTHIRGFRRGVFVAATGDTRRLRALRKALEADTQNTAAGFLNMRYEHQTTLGVPPEYIHAISELREYLQAAIRRVLNSQHGTDVAALRVDISDSGTKLVARMLFVDGTRAQCADDTATETLYAAFKVAGFGDAELREESVRLQSVY